MAEELVLQGQLFRLSSHGIGLNHDVDIIVDACLNVTQQDIINFISDNQGKDVEVVLRIRE